MKRSSYFLIASLAVFLSARGYNYTLVEKEIESIGIFLKDLYTELPAEKKLAETLEIIINNGFLKQREITLQEVIEINQIIQQKDLIPAEKAIAIKQIIKKYTAQVQNAEQKKQKKWNKEQQKRDLKDKLCTVEHQINSIQYQLEDQSKSIKKSIARIPTMQHMINALKNENLSIQNTIEIVKGSAAAVLAVALGCLIGYDICYESYVRSGLINAMKMN